MTLPRGFVLAVLASLLASVSLAALMHRTQTVIDVQHVKAEPPRDGEVEERDEKRDGVSTTGHAHEDRLAAGQHRIAAERALDPLRQRHR